MFVSSHLCSSRANVLWLWRDTWWRHKSSISCRSCSFDQATLHTYVHANMKEICCGSGALQERGNGKLGNWTVLFAVKSNEASSNEPTFIPFHSQHFTLSLQFHRLLYVVRFAGFLRLIHSKASTAQFDRQNFWIEFSFYHFIRCRQHQQLRPKLSRPMSV